MMYRASAAAILLPLLFGSAAFADEPVIGQKDKMFSQDAVTVKKGGSVQFINDDNVQHNLSVREPDATTRPGVVQDPGRDSHLTFDKTGDNLIRCLIHPKMKMTVHVE